MGENNRRTCTRCGKSLPETTDNFYIRNPSGKHKSIGWQSACKSCWKEINSDNKKKRHYNELTEVQ